MRCKQGTGMRFSYCRLLFQIVHKGSSVAYHIRYDIELSDTRDAAIDETKDGIRTAYQTSQ